MKRGRKEKVLLSESPNENMSRLNFEVNKTVKGADGKDFKRKATISFEVPEKMDDLPGIVAIFGSVEKLAQAAFYGVKSKARIDATNELMKGDKASKALKKMVASLKVVMPTLTDETATAMVLGNPGMAEAFKSEPVGAEINVSVNPASDDFKFPALTEEEEKEEDDEKTEAETPAA